MLYWGATAPLFYEKNSSFAGYPHQFNVSGYFSFYWSTARTYSPRHRGRCAWVCQAIL